MMKTTMKFLTYVLMAFTLVLTSCDGEDGANGLDGAIGPEGPAGQDGNANVIASPWVASGFSTSSTDFTFFDVADPLITQEIVDGAAIYAYGKIGEAAVSIPFTFTNKTYYFALFPDTNQFRFLAASVDGTSEIFNDLSEVRYVIIPASISSGRSAIDHTDYEAVKEAYNLKD